MELIDDLEMPSETRIIWVSDEAETKWKTKINSASRVFQRLEIETVAHGLRECALASIPPDRLDERVASLSQKGLVFLPFTRAAEANGFGHSLESPDPDERWVYRGVVSESLESARAYVEAYNSNDDVTRGKLLGYPTCCAKFFDEVWSQGYFDPVWQSAKNTAEEYVVSRSETRIRLSRDVPHILFSGVRYIGLRFCPHFVCKFNCQESLNRVEEWVELARELDIDGWTELLTVLRWPVKWDCLKGISLVSTPLFRISTSSMPCYPKYVVEKEGVSYPDCAPTALEFPWQKPESTKSWDPEIDVMGDTTNEGVAQ